MGDEADDNLKSFHLSDGDSKKYKTVKEKLDEHFIRWQNVITRGPSLTNVNKSRKNQWIVLLNHYTVRQIIASMNSCITKIRGAK